MTQNPEQLANHSAQNTLPQQASRSKPPQAIWNHIFAFPPNRDTLGGTAYLIVENDGNILIDCPPWNEDIQQFLQSLLGVKWLFLTHRGAISKSVKEIQTFLNCEVVIQEQEAYLLPKVQLTSFQHEITLSPTTQGIWTPGHSPGSACLYYQSHGGILFSGRHLLPNQQGEPTPLRTAKTFHWRRQINSVEKLLQRFTPETLQYICPGANTGFLRGKKVIDQAYQRLAALDLAALVQFQAPL
ncbi:beta-lactamase [Gloeocapsa sp. PCC 7428]|uniref:MBL fold metallo-hydrolase n=1 Tax=Gloeocapsa sp. PCC 7428 TaxID=1173026 RepID=UPI0002A5F5E9|nr:beta-lactamase [Gloeocapsa sp. PCC 7428]